MLLFVNKLLELGWCKWPKNKEDCRIEDRFIENPRSAGLMTLLVTLYTGTSEEKNRTISGFQRLYFF